MNESLPLRAAQTRIGIVNARQGAATECRPYNRMKRARKPPPLQDFIISVEETATLKRLNYRTKGERR
jgi:hypothetical protein